MNACTASSSARISLISLIISHELVYQKEHSVQFTPISAAVVERKIKCAGGAFS